MKLLSIFQTGGLTLGLTLVMVLLNTWLSINAGKEYAKTKVPFYKNPFYGGVLLITIAYFFAMTQVASDYRPYNPNKDGIPQEQTDTTRQAAEDMIKK